MKTTIFLCFLAVTLSSAEASRDHNLATTLISPKKQAEKFIRELNLFPDHGANIVENDPLVDAPRIVETSFRFPGLSSHSAGETVNDFGHHAGYFKLRHAKGARMFYYFFESRNKNATDPVVVWLTGGPGCSSSLALFYENGPFHLRDDLSLAWNRFGWDKTSNIIFVDQPTGTGFSYSSSSDDIRASSVEAAGDFYDFLQAFFKKHPQYAKNDFYITGESYAGHYVPAFATTINQNNKNKTGIHINLKGIAIGNGLTDPTIQYKAYTQYALDMKLIDRSQYNSLNRYYYSSCEEQIKTCGNGSSDCDQAMAVCNNIFDEIVSSNFGINYYDIRKECKGILCYDFSNVEKFLNKESVKQALGVGHREFISCSTDVYEAMTGDWMKNYAAGIPKLLHDGIKCLVYAGEYDLICNWLGNSWWVEKMKWSGRKAFHSAPLVPFMVQRVQAGVRKSYSCLTFLKVHKAGHMVPMDQPKAALKMLSRWMRNKHL